MKYVAGAVKGGFYLNMDRFFETMQKAFKYFTVNDKYMEIQEINRFTLCF